jgi:hypothetical protein
MKMVIGYRLLVIGKPLAVSSKQHPYGFDCPPATAYCLLFSREITL